VDAHLPAAAPPPDFTGRLAAIEALAPRTPAPDLAVTFIIGPPGVRKTALAVMAHTWPGQVTDGQLYAGLGGVGQARAPLDILGELLPSLGVPPRRVPAGLAEQAALYRSVLAYRQAAWGLSIGDLSVGRRLGRGPRRSRTTASFPWKSHLRSWV